MGIALCFLGIFEAGFFLNLKIFKDFKKLIQQ